MAEADIKRKKRAEYSIGDVQKVAENRLGKCLTEIYSGISSEYEFNCDKGHKWRATFGNVLYNNTWCRECAIEKRYGYSLDYLKKIAESQNAILLSEEYMGHSATYFWKCKAHGHIEEEELREYKARGCSQCKRPSKLDTAKVRERMEEISMTLLDDEFLGIGYLHHWKCENCGNIKRGTFKNIYYANKGCLECKKDTVLDRKKEKIKEMALAKGYELVEFKTLYPDYECVLKCLEKGHIRSGNYSMLKSKSGCAECANERKVKYSYEDAVKIAEEREGHLLSEEFDSKMVWQCKENHKWGANFYNVKNGTWCPECSKKKGNRGRPKKIK